MVETMWKVRTGPAHVRVRVFTRTLPTETWALSGKLVFHVDEWWVIHSRIPEDWVVVKDEPIMDTDVYSGPFDSDIEADRKMMDEG